MTPPNRTLVQIGAILLILSTLFPIVASLIPASRLPAWVGVVDVAIAFALVILGGWMDWSTRDQRSDAVIHASYRLYRAIASLPLILLIIFFLVGDRILWNVLLPGLAWRSWLLLYVLPAAAALYDKPNEIARS